MRLSIWPRRYDPVDARASATTYADAPVGRAVLISNSSWGIVSHVSQTLLLTLFFVILARYYSADEFAKFVIANALMQMLLAFSALGLGNWFIREVAGATVDRKRLILTFLSTQVYSGLLFGILNVAIAFALYQDRAIRIIAMVFAANIVFDNIINALKCLNIADFQQRKTFVLLAFDAFLRCAVASALFVLPFTMVTLTLVLLATRVVTLNLFLKLGTAGEVSVSALYAGRHVSRTELRTLVLANWPWIMLAGISVVNWRIGNIIISKRLTMADTAIYEISYRLFAAAMMLPVIVATTVFPILVRLYNAADMASFRTLYRRTYVYYLLFGCLAYSFIYSFAGALVPLVFGAKYATAAMYARQMFLTMVVFPTAFLQGNVLMAMRLERRDMWLNLVLLGLNVSISLVGLAYWRSLVVINVALVAAFVVFHLLQDTLLIRRGIGSVGHAVAFHALAVAFVVSYSLLAGRSSSYLVFPLYWTSVLLIAAIVMRNDAGLRAYLGRALPSVSR